MLPYIMAEIVDLKKLVDRARGDIALANPVNFLIRLMAGEEIGEEKLGLRDRMEVAKFLAGRQVPQLQAMELTGEGGNPLLPPPLTITLAVSKNELKTVSEGLEASYEAQGVEIMREFE